MGGESRGEADGGPVEEGSHPECAPVALLQACCLASKNIYSLPKTAQGFFSHSGKVKTMRLINLNYSLEASQPGSYKNPACLEWCCSCDRARV